MSRADLQRRLEGLMARGLPHRAWDVACSLIEGDGEPTLRRVLKYGFLRTYLVHRLPASFWDERREKEARRLEINPVRPPPRVGEVAFPVVFPAQETGCFVVAAVRSIDASQDELPPEEEVDGDARRAMEEALDAARRLTGEPRHFRVSLDKPFPEIVRGSSCGLAVALAALSYIEDRELDDGILATGEVTRELAIRPVRDLARKSALRREARPLARLLCPLSDGDEEGLVPVSRLEDARRVVWKPTPGAVEEALTKLKRARAEDPNHLHLPFRGLAKLARGADTATLELLGFAVAPSLYDERKKLAESETELRRQLRDREDLTGEEYDELVRKLRRMERRRWNPHEATDEDERSYSFAQVLHQYAHFTVIGDPGAGKSLLTRLVFLACSSGEVGKQARVLLLGHAGFDPRAVKAIQSLREQLPVRLVLAEFSRALGEKETLSFEEFIRRELRAEGARHALFDGLGELLEAGRLFVLCDGLDEVPEELRERVVDRLLAFAKSYSRVRILVTSRPHGYYPKVDEFHHTQLAPLDYWQRRLLVARLHRLVEARSRPGPEGVARARRRTNELLLAIEKRDEWEQLSGNPLLLTLSALTRTNADGVPEHQVFVFEGLIRTILGEWRSALKRPPAEADRLLEVWSSVAAELVQQEDRERVGQARLLRMLSARLGAGPVPSPIDAKTALNLALETGLVRESGPMFVSFWHSTLGEFLAARFLAGDGAGAVERLLRGRLTPQTLHFAAALLDHVLEARDECSALAGTLLDRDAEGVHQLLRPGLLTVSAWLVDGVRFNAGIRERIWEAWLEVLERNPPSPLWGDFGRFADRAPRKSVPPRLVARLACVDDRRVEEVREGLARVVAPAAKEEPAALAACEEWMKESFHPSLRIHGAFGLALASTEAWSDEVIDGLGRFASTQKINLHDVHRLVRNSGAATLARLRELVRESLPSEERQDQRAGGSTSEARDESDRRKRRLSAACLLTVAGHWDEAVARVMRLAFEGQSSSFQDDELQSVMRFHADEPAVREALLKWIRGGSALGERAIKLVRDVAPLFEDMPQKVLECMASAEGRERDQLVSLLVAIGEELYTLPELLRRCLEDERKDVELRMSAARILCQLAPEDGDLHRALRRGMGCQDDAARARWAQLALGLEQGLSKTAMETLLACARSPDPAVRTWVYEGEPAKLMWRLGTERLEGWLDCAADKSVAPAARLDALEAAERVQTLREQTVPILRELLHVEDTNVRRKAARKLIRSDVLDEHAVIILAEEAVRSGGGDHFRLWDLHRALPLAAVTVRTLLRELSSVVPSGASQDSRHDVMNWSSLLRSLAEAEPSCAEDLLRALDHPGLVGEVARAALTGPLEKHEAVRSAFRERLRRAVTEMSPLGQFRLVHLGLWGDEKFPEAIELARTMNPGLLTQNQLDRLAGLLWANNARQDAVRLWRLVLEGEGLDLVLDAAEPLAGWFPEEVGAWIRPAVERLFGSSEPTHRVEAGRFALRYGFMEEEARTALLDCLGQAGREFTRRSSQWLWKFGSPLHRGSRPANGELLDGLLVGWSRVDFEAMHALCGHWPEVGMPRLAAWLEDDDSKRFSKAVRILAEEDAYRDRVRATLENRLRSGPLEQLDLVIQLVEKHGFYSENMVERFLTRYTSGAPLEPRLNNCLSHWLNRRPGLWAVFRRQPPELREVLAQWLSLHHYVESDEVAFAVEFVLLHADDGIAWVAETRLQHWCEPPPDRDAGQAEPDEKPPLWSPELVRRWIREALAEQDLPTELSRILVFDKLATLGEVRAEQRIELLSRALAIEVAPVEDDGGSQLHCQALAALRLLELGDRDERIPSVLEAAVHILEKSHDFDVLRFANALRTVRPANESLRDALVHILLCSRWALPFEWVPDLLDLAGLSVEQRIDVLLARLNSEHGWTQASDIFDALEALGCPPERRAALILDFVSRHEERLSASVLLALAARSELAAIAEAKLLLIAIMKTRGLEGETALQRWLERFASKAVLDDDDRWWSYRDSNYLSLRQRTLARLSKVDEPALVDRALAELATARSDDLFALYRHARAAQALSQTEWSDLLALLTLGPHDKGSTRLAKEWLTLGLWQSWEPMRIDAWFRS